MINCLIINQNEFLFENTRGNKYILINLCTVDMSAKFGTCLQKGMKFFFLKYLIYFEYNTLYCSCIRASWDRFYVLLCKLDSSFCNKPLDISIIDKKQLVCCCPIHFIQIKPIKLVVMLM